MSGKENKPAEEKADINPTCQCVEAQQDWFLAKNLIKNSSKSKPTKSREGVYATFLCNKELFDSLQQDILNVKHVSKGDEAGSIDIVSYDFDPSLRLLGPNIISASRDMGYEYAEEASPIWSRLGALLYDKAARFNNVRILAWKSNKITANPPKGMKEVKAVGQYAKEYLKGMTADIYESIGRYYKRGKFNGGSFTANKFGINIYTTLGGIIYSSSRYSMVGREKEKWEVLEGGISEQPDNVLQSKPTTGNNAVKTITMKDELNTVKNLMVAIMLEGGSKEIIEDFNENIYNYRNNAFYLPDNLILEDFQYEVEAHNYLYNNVKTKKVKTLDYKYRTIQTDQSKIAQGYYVVTDITIITTSTAFGTELGVTIGAFGGGPLGAGAGALIGAGIGLVIGVVLSDINSKLKENDKYSHNMLKNQTMLKAYKLKADKFTWREQKSLGLDKKRSEMLKYEVADHQSFIVINGATPKKGAAGYVMGHQLTKKYYDNNSHHFISNDRWPGNGPVQVASVRLEGPILRDLYQYFGKVWDGKVKAACPEKEYMITRTLNHGEYKVKAQICQTDPRYSQQLIFAQYLRAISNACQYLYFEMEYFHYPTIAEHICNRAKERDKAGKDLYLFIVTNSNLHPYAAESSFRTMSQLGYKDAFPAYQREYTQELYHYYVGMHKKTLPKDERKSFRSTYHNVQKVYANQLPPTYDQFLKLRHDDVVDLLKIRHPVNWEYADIALAIDNASEFDPKYNRVPAGAIEEEMDEHIQIEEVDGLKAVIASLKTAESYTQLDGKKLHFYVDIDVQSKLMIVDDAFSSIGSANVSMLGMKGNTELNVGIEGYQFTHSALESLWKMHANQPPTNNKKKDYGDWMDILKFNWAAIQNQEALRAHLFPYHDPDLRHGKGKDLY